MRAFGEHLLLVRLDALLVLFLDQLLMRVNLRNVENRQIVGKPILLGFLSLLLDLKLLLRQKGADLFINGAALDPKFWFASNAGDQPVEKVLKLHAFEVVFRIDAHFDQVSLQLINSNTRPLKLCKLHENQVI